MFDKFENCVSLSGCASNYGFSPVNCVPRSSANSLSFYKDHSDKKTEENASRPIHAVSWQ